MKKSIILFLSLFSISILLNAQQGILSGTIIEESTGESLIGATIAVTGTSIGTITDFDGKYSLKLEQGIYNITISYVSYESKIISDIEIKSGTNTRLDLGLAEAKTAIAEVKVVARSRQQNEIAMQNMQRKSANVLDGVSAQQISRLGDSDAASVLKRLSGVSVQEGKYVYVRGLSDRYMKVTLNGGEVPGLDPNINTVQMDLFPSNIIENITVLKTYSPDRPSFTGGLVDIVTKDFPEKFTLKFSTSLGYNRQSNLNNDFIAQPKSSTDWLGFDDGLRGIPERATKEFLYSPARKDERLAIEEVTNSFNENVEPIQSKSFLDYSHSLSFGNNFSIGKKKLGLIAALSYKKDYSFYDDGVYSEYSALDNKIMQNKISLDEKAGTDEVIWSALTGLTLKLNQKNKIGLMLLRSQSGASTAKYRDGFSNYDGFNMRHFVQEYLERQLTSVQFKGKHVLPFLNNAFIEWSTGAVNSIQNEPDIRMFIDRVDKLSDGTLSYEMIDNRKPDRRYRDLSGQNIDSRISLTLPLANLSGNPKLKVGVAQLQKNRNSVENLWKLNWYRTVPYEGSPTDFVSNWVYNDEDNFGIYYFNSKKSNQESSYSALETISSAFAMVDFPFFEKLRFVAGFRYEKDALGLHNNVDTIEFSDDVEAYKSTSRTIEEWLPSINFTYSINEKTNLKVGYNKTVARPLFREIAPYQFYNFMDGIPEQGNPELHSGNVDNLDLRLEYFMKKGQIIALGAFYKYFESPIEKYLEQSSNSLIKYRNGQDATLYGIEFEVRKNFDFIGIEDLIMGTNLTFIESFQQEDSIRLAQAKVTVPDWPTQRRMYGQAPYNINTFLSYSNSKTNLSVTLSYNISGPKIINISQYQTPDIQEMPMHLLNIVASKSLGEHFNVKVKVKNILNQASRKSYILDGEEYYYRYHSTGTNYEIGMEYKF